METAVLVCLVFAFVCFLLSAFCSAAKIPQPLDLVALGLAFWVVTLIPGLVR